LSRHLAGSITVEIDTPRSFPSPRTISKSRYAITPAVTGIFTLVLKASYAQKVLAERERSKAKKRAARSKVVVPPPKGDGFAALKAAAAGRRKVA
jgi:hypothetical protein